MEGAGYIRAHSEKVELRTNIFAEDNDNVDGEGEGEDGQAADEGAEDEMEQEHIYYDDNGKPINFEDIVNLAE